MKRIVEPPVSYFVAATCNVSGKPSETPIVGDQMSILGTSVRRTEDPAFLTVGGKYIDDIAPANALHLTFVRSVMAHALVESIQTTEAKAMPGVAAVFVAEDLGIVAEPPGHPLLNQAMLRSRLAIDRVRYVGEAVAVVVSDTREQGVDAAELVEIDYSPLHAVIDFDESLAETTLIFPDAGTNVAASIADKGEDIFGDCEITVSLSFRNGRVAPCPMEGRATTSMWELGENGEMALTQWASTQGAHGTRDGLANALGIDKGLVRVIAPDIGGGFGAKNGMYSEDVICALIARKMEVPTRWAETRSEGMLGLVHGRAVQYQATIGGTRDGNITAFKLHVTQDSGGYPAIGAVLPNIMSTVCTGPYDIPAVQFSSTSIITNTAPVGAYRGAGRPEAALAVDRMVDLFATEIGLSPIDVRHLNFHAPEAFPLRTPTGAQMDTGEYSKALDAAVEQAGVKELLVEQKRRLSESCSKVLGIGVSAYIEIANPMGQGEFGSIEVQPDGSAIVLTGSSAHGQGHHTAFAQIAADLTGIDFDKIEVRHGDTSEVARGGGTGGSKSLQVGGSAVWRASEAAVETARQAAAAMLEANPADVILDVDAGSFSVAGTPALSLSWIQVAKSIKEETGSNLLAESDFTPPGATFPFGAHVAVVEVDIDTGEVTLLRHIACDDAGTMVNPMLVEGQVHGGIASGVAQALMEEFHYDSIGNPLTSNFMDYPLVSAAELPSFERVPMETPTPHNPIGAKGIGESATIGSTPAVQNAVINALSHLGVRHIDIPTTAERVWKCISESTSS